MSRRYLLSSIAEADVAEIAEYIANDNPDAALRLVDRVTATFDMLLQNPHAGERHPHPRVELRRFPIGNYIVFYQTTDEGLVVVRVLHGARQYDDLL